MLLCLQIKIPRGIESFQGSCLVAPYSVFVPPFPFSSRTFGFNQLPAGENGSLLPRVAVIWEIDYDALALIVDDDCIDWKLTVQVLPFAIWHHMEIDMDLFSLSCPGWDDKKEC